MLKTFLSIIITTNIYASCLSNLITRTEEPRFNIGVQLASVYAPFISPDKKELKHYNQNLFQWASTESTPTKLSTDKDAKYLVITNDFYVRGSTNLTFFTSNHPTPLVGNHEAFDHILLPAMDVKLANLKQELYIGLEDILDLLKPQGTFRFSVPLANSRTQSFNIPSKKRIQTLVAELKVLLESSYPGQSFSVTAFYHEFDKKIGAPSEIKQLLGFMTFIVKKENSIAVELNINPAEYILNDRRAYPIIRMQQQPNPVYVETSVASQEEATTQQTVAHKPKRRGLLRSILNVVTLGFTK